VARKSDGMTPRQRQSQQIMRDKTAMKKRKHLMRRVYIIGGSVLSLIILSGGVWFWKSGAAQRTVQAISDVGYGITAGAGYVVQDIYLEGRSRTPMDEVEKAMDIKKGDPILRFSVGEVRERLEKIESVKIAAVERALPGTVYVRLVEREPVALWQNNGKIALVDDNGVVMKGVDVAPYQKLPLLVGEGAPAHVKELMEIINSQPELAKRLSSAIRVSDRRWNIRLNIGSRGDIEVKLPEKNPVDAWAKVAELQTSQQLLDRDITVIDLRLEGKMFIKLSPEDASDKAANAKET
jgi:cell division protein FtsQ